MYRDEANYKQFNEIVFSNTSNLSLKDVETRVKKKLIDGQWLVAKDWGLPDMHFKEFTWDSEIDHDWHEFESIEETLELVPQETILKIFFHLLLRLNFYGDSISSIELQNDEQDVATGDYRSDLFVQAGLQIINEGDDY